MKRTGHYHQLVEAARAEILRAALRLTQGNRTAAARHLGLPRTSLIKMLHKLGLQDYERGTWGHRESETVPIASQKERRSR